MAMTSKFIAGGCIVSFIGVVVVTYVVTEPVGDVNAPSLVVGSDRDSDVMILTSRSAALLPPQVNDVVDLWGIRPVEFLKALKMERASTYPYFFREPVKNWISKNDLPDLLALAESTEPCPSVNLTASSAANLQASDMGQQALFMIEGYRKGEYPPALNSGGYTEDAAKELKDWCRGEIAKSGD